MLAIAISMLSHNRNGNLVLDLNKLQVFIYLIKNPSKIDDVLLAAGKKPAFIESKLTYTIKSYSSNVDVLFDNRKIKFLLKKMASSGLLLAEKIKEDTTKLYLSNKGQIFSAGFSEGYFLEIKKMVSAILPLQSLPTPKLNAILNQVFKGAK
ncbi:hypothetical protein EH227_03245 [Rouxiella chamberiensis]|nr:hypothetical protein EH227_03245 [Rouxiella chamberiensis]